MAHKGGYPGYPTQPPPQAGYPSQGYAPPPYPGATNTVIIQQQQPVVVGRSSRGFLGGMLHEVDKIGSSIGREAGKAAKPSIEVYRLLQRVLYWKYMVTGTLVSAQRGLLGQLGHELNVLGKTVSREVDWTATQINRSLATTSTGNLLSLFVTGNVVQLVSRSNGGCLEVVQGPHGLTVDGRGTEGAAHATWTVINEGNNQVRLHNNNNFLSIMNGNTVLLNMPAGVMQGVETKFQLFQVGQFIYLESMKERGRHIGILPNGQLKSALATGKELHSQFGVRLLYSPYQPATVTTVTHKH